MCKSVLIILFQSFLQYLNEIPLFDTTAVHQFELIPAYFVSHSLTPTTLRQDCLYRHEVLYHTFTQTEEVRNMKPK